MTSCRQASISKFDNIPQNDTFCLKEVTKAKADIDKSKLVYCNFEFFPQLRCEKEMTEALKKFNITYENEVASDVIVEGYTNNCYCGYMQEQIDKKFGKKFTDSLLYISDSIYISKNLDKTYDYTSWDNAPVFPDDKDPNSLNHSGLQKAFEKQFVYSKDYKYKNSDASLAMAKVFVYIDNTGKAKVDSCEFIFWNSQTKEEDFNKSTWPSLEKTFRPIIEQTQWTPAKIKSFAIKSKNEIFVYFK